MTAPYVGHGVDLGMLDARLLMELQYRFPVEPEPYRVVAERLGIGVDEVLERLRLYLDAGIVKRVGFYLHYGSMGHRAALVGLSVPRSLVSLVPGIVGRDPRITHAYLREHPRYNVWIVVRGRSLEEARRVAEEVSAATGSESLLFLPSVETLKLSVKYDLARGVSWSAPNQAAAQPRIRVDPDTLRVLRRLRRLPLARRPFERVAEEEGMGLDELLALVREMLDAGVLADPGAVLDGWLLGFRHNVLLAIRRAECCREVARSVPEATHVVLRRPQEGWEYRCYVMVHSMSRGAAARLVERITGIAGCGEHQALYSVSDLKPGVVR